MPTQARKHLLQQRRRAKHEGDDDESVKNENFDDSASEASLLSDADDADADDSDLTDGDDAETLGSDKKPTKINKSSDRKRPVTTTQRQQSFQTVKDTEVMMNGLSLTDEPVSTEPIDFDSADKENEGTKDSRKLLEKKPSNNEEYKKRIESDPAFIPTRGAFFMHDSRSANNGQNNFRVMRGGRGRGRGGPTGLMPQNSGHVSQQPSNNQWSHDLHESLLEPDSKSGATTHQFVPKQTHKPIEATPKSFSTSQLLGKVVVRVFIQGMSVPKTFSDVPVNRYTKLPTHRPPLRRDKPVRVFIPQQPVKYIFPALDRSFIFIPRNLRPNQQGFGRGRGKGLGSMGGISSRRTSIYGGSFYSPSVAMSRRSSIARESMMASPAGSIMSSRPVVRLPGSHHPGGSIASIHGPGSSTGTPAMIGAGPFVPPRPAYRENWSNVQMHQPRPQKTISVTGIEIPAATHMEATTPDQSYHQQAYMNQHQQPFHHQFPQANGAVQDPSAYGHVRQPSYPVQSGTPLSNIPERAIHAQAFQPYQNTYPYQGQPTYFYPPNAYPPGTVIAPIFVPHQQYMLQSTAGAPPSAVPPQGIPSATTPGGMVAHEQNGMVYYFDPSQMPQQQSEQFAAQHQQQQQQQGYQNMPVMMPPPPQQQQVPDGYYYPSAGPVYYAPQ